jgi:hypothetical protein
MTDPKQLVTDQISAIDRQTRPHWEALRLYRPSPKGTGTALKLEVRLAPQYHAKGYVESVDGGVFLELARQAGQDGAGNATFAWTEALRAKLGLADLTALLACLRATWAGWEQLPGTKPDRPSQRALFHKTEAGSTIIDYSRVDGGAFLRISKSADQKVAHRLSMEDLIAVEAYLALALDAVLRLGVR